jgi:hypothetical protein
MIDLSDVNEELKKRGKSELTATNPPDEIISKSLRSNSQIPSPQEISDKLIGKWPQRDDPRAYLREQLSPENVHKAINAAAGTKMMPLSETAGLPQIISQGLQKLPGFAKAGVDYAGNVAKSAATGAAMSEDPMKELPKAGLIAAGAEAVIPGAKLIGGLAETMRPLKFTQEMVTKIKDMSEAAGKEAGKYLNPIWKEFGADKLFHGTKLKDDFYDKIKDVMPYLGAKAKLTLREFMKDPTINEANSLRRVFGESMGSLSTKTEAERNAIFAYKSVRDLLKDKMYKTIQAKNPQMADDFLTGTDIFRAKGAQFKNDPFMQKLLGGHMEDVEPSQLLKVLKRMKEKGGFEPGLSPQRLQELGIHGEHYLKQALNDLHGKQFKGDMLKHALTIGLGAMGGHGLAGVGGAEVLQHFIAPHILKLLQSKQLQEGLGKLVEPGRKAVQTLIPSIGSLIGS